MSLLFFFFRRIGQFIFTKFVDLQPSISAGTCFPDVRSAELGELIGMGVVVGGDHSVHSGPQPQKQPFQWNDSGGKNTITTNGLSIYRTITALSGKHLDVRKQIASKSALSMYPRSTENYYRGTSAITAP